MWPRLFLLLALVPMIRSLAPTDEVQDADPAQSGYLDNHNMHPATVGSSIFGILWKNTYNSKEKWYAKPLVYTPPGQSQLVFIASSMNVIRTLDAVNGTLLNSRTVQPPFLQSDIGCTDIPDYIGIVGTPILDPSTNTVYFFSKGYKNGASSGGVANGIYKFYAVDIITLQDRPGFPVLIDGSNADNDRSRYFIGGTVLQRPSLTMINGVVIGGFGGHCDLFNYTGMIVAVSTSPGVGVTSLFAMESSPGAPPVVSDITVQQGGKAGIWQSGMGLATDNNRLFCATGNGMGHANGDVPASGRTPLSTLDEVVGSFTVSSAGKISLSDYFEPYEYISMDAGDRDLGSGGIALLDPTVFNGKGVSRIGVSIGKNGKAYIMNANNLGGFKQGSGGTDNILQTIVAAGSVFGGAGSYPLEGGYIYFTPVGSPTVCYKLGLDSAGAPIFTLVGQTSSNSAGRVGVGVPTITTYKGQAGTGILWISDPSAGLQAFNAVPVNGVLTPIPLSPTGGLNKFQRPAFGDGRLYVSDSNGNVICLGSPVALPLQCTQPVDFGDVQIGATSTKIINCTALIAITAINGCTTADKTFQCSNSTFPKGSLAKGDTFSFPVVWNLTQASINDAQNASFGKVLPGVQSTSLDIFTTNAVAKYSNLLPISLSGNTVSKAAFLTISPPEVDLGGIVVGSDAATSGLSAAVILSNVGAANLTFLGSAWTDDVDTEDGDVITYTNITNGNLGSGFSSSSLPAVGSQLSTGQSITVPVKFLASQTGSYSTFVEWWTTGGNGYVLLTGSASTAPIANISVSTIEGGWDYSEPVIMDFGNVQAGNTTSRYIRICNEGGSALAITKSKPPIDTELLAPNSAVDLHEGQTIDVNDCADGQVSIVAAPLGVNRLDHVVSDVWILNTDDLNFGIHDVQVTANIRTKQVGPLLTNGSAEYLYLGCYYDGGGRLLAKQYNPNNNENGVCQQTCYNAGYTFAGTEYHTQCWCGNTAPTAAKYTDESLKKCAFSCPGDVSQACGGDGTYISIFYDRTKYKPGSDSIPGSSSSSSISTQISTSSLGSTSSTGSTSLSTTLTSSSSLLSSSQTGSVTSTSSSSSATPTQTGPAIVQSVGPYKYVGCYTETTTGHALSAKIYSNDGMTIEICASTCAGYAWFGVEYRRECYCGNSPAAGSVVATTGNTCSLTCMGNALEYCGGSSRLQMYNNLTSSSSTLSISGSSSVSVSSTSSQALTTSSTGSASVSSTSSRASTSSSASLSTSSASSSSSVSTSSVSSSSFVVSTSSSSLSASSSSSSVLSTSSSASSSSSIVSTSSSSLSTSSSGSVTSSSTSSLSIPSSSSSRTSSSPVSSSSSSVSSPVSTTSSASPTSSVSSTSSTVSSSQSSSSSQITTSSSTTLITTTSSQTTTSSTVSAYMGFASLGCFSDPANGPYGGHNMPKLFSNDSMTPQLCISSARARLSATPATTYLYAGVEYGRECYAGSVAPTPEPTSLAGAKACTMTCKGDARQSCGGANMYNLYGVTSASITGTGTTVWASAPAVSTVA